MIPLTAFAQRASEVPKKSNERKKSILMMQLPPFGSRLSRLDSKAGKGVDRQGTNPVGDRRRRNGTRKHPDSKASHGKSKGGTGRDEQFSFTDNLLGSDKKSVQ